MAPKKVATPLVDILERLSEKDKEPKILIVGQTGSGKTTVLNYLSRFSLTAGVPVDQLNKEHIQGLLDGHVHYQANESGGSSGQSQTVGPAEYRIPITQSGRTTTVVVLDTPGFADTKGAERDKKHEQFIVDLVNKHHYLTCVLFVINGASTRIHPTTRYTMATITSLMPRDILQNVLILHSFLDSKEKCKFPQEEMTQCFEVHPMKFYLDNPLALLQGFENQAKGSAVESFDAVDWSIPDHEEDEDGEKGKNVVRQMAKGARVMTQILEKVATFESYATNAIYELKENKDKISSGLLQLSLAIKTELQLQNDLCEAERRIRENVEAEDVFHTEWVLKDSESYHYYCQIPRCAAEVGAESQPCCFKMEAGHGEYESWRLTVLLAIITLGIRHKDWRLAEDRRKVALMGKQAASNVTFHCPCRHPVSEHVGGFKEFVCKRTLCVSKEDITSENPEDAKARFTVLHDASAKKVQDITESVRAALNRYNELGLPSAFEHLLTAQKAYYEELIKAEMGDKKTIDGMIEDVAVMQEQLHRGSDIFQAQ